MRQKKGFELSFNFILSIIIIAFIIAAAGYAIKYFLDLRSCTELGLFYQDLQREVDKTWNSEIARQTFKGTVPSEITSVCIGNVTRTSNLPQYSSLKRFARQNYMLFFYPVEKTCDQAAYPISHLDQATSNSLKCFQVKSNKVEFTITKDSSASLVSITT